MTRKDREHRRELARSWRDIEDAKKKWARLTHAPAVIPPNMHVSSGVWDQSIVDGQGEIDWRSLIPISSAETFGRLRCTDCGKIVGRVFKLNDSLALNISEGPRTGWAWLDGVDRLFVFGCPFCHWTEAVGSIHIEENIPGTIRVPRRGRR